ncbi:MAG: hypothetical protein PHH83_03570 [Patescibacteria group bacterium]|nr:hypothetical protein [Patescibacteria group bacterium]
MKIFQKLLEKLITFCYKTLYVIKIILIKFFLRTFRKKIPAKCGHYTHLKDVITFNGFSSIIKIMDKNVPYCHKCLEKMTIRCIWCGNPIFIGNLITLQNPKGTFKIPKYAIKNNDFPGGYVGCKRKSCCDMLGELIALWTAPGKIELVKEYKKNTQTDWIE